MTIQSNHSRFAFAALFLGLCALTQACAGRVQAETEAEPASDSPDQAAHCYVNGAEGTLVPVVDDAGNPEELCCTIVCFHLTDPTISVAR